MFPLYKEVLKGSLAYLACALYLNIRCRSIMLDHQLL